MFCTNCGTKNSDGALFCTNCGAPLNQTQQAAANVPTDEIDKTLNEAQQAVDEINSGVSTPGNELELDKILGRTAAGAQPEANVQPQANTYAQPQDNANGGYNNGAYNGNSPYSEGNTKKLNKQTKTTIYILIAALVVVAAVCVLLFTSGLIGGKTYKSYEDLVDDYLTTIGDVNGSKLYKMRNADVVKAMRKAYNWSEDDDEFVQDTDSLYYTAKKSGVAVPEYEFYNVTDYSDMLDQFASLNSAAGTSFDVKEVVIVEIDAVNELTDEQYSYYDSYYYLTLYRTDKSWYMLFVG